MGYFKYRTASAEETIQLGAKIGGLLKGGEIIAYRGGMGAGKTTFTRGLCVGMGLPDEVSSPTFSLVNEYRKDGKLRLCHFDMYRISGAESLETTGFYDYMGECVLAVEWSENVVEFLPKETIVITFNQTDDGEDSREIIVEGELELEAIGN